MDTTTRWPIDFASLKKGQTIGEDIIKDYAQAEPGSDAYKLKQLGLAGIIEQKLRAVGKAWTVRCARNVIEILTDSQAAVYTVKQRNQSRKRMHRNYKRQMGVDVAELTDAERIEHDRQTLLSSHLISAQRQVARTYSLTAVKRDTPMVGVKE